MKRYLITTTMAGILLSNSFGLLASIDKPNVMILATGGTIAGSSDSNTDTTNYKAGQLSVETLIQAVPEMQNVANVSGEQIANIDSSNMNSEILLKLAKRVNQLLSDPKETGVVITHGTDTLEETAFFLDLTVKNDKPVVLVGSMRPATAISADGPINLLQAVTLAADSNAKNRGTMIVLNDRIGSGFYISKTNSTMTDTFKSVEQGYLGAFIAGEPNFYYTAAQPTGKPYFDVSQLTTLPKVDILYGYQDQDSSLLEAAINSGTKGIVFAATGNGTVPTTMVDAVKKAMAKGIPVVRATRTGAGYVTPSTAISSGLYSPQKARIVLALALAEGASMEQIRAYFEPETAKK